MRFSTVGVVIKYTNRLDFEPYDVIATGTVTVAIFKQSGRSGFTLHRSGNQVWLARRPIA